MSGNTSDDVIRLSDTEDEFSEDYISALLVVSQGDYDRKGVTDILQACKGVYRDAMNIILLGRKPTKKAKANANSVIKTENTVKPEDTAKTEKEDKTTGSTDPAHVRQTQQANDFHTSHRRSIAGSNLNRVSELSRNTADDVTHLSDTGDEFKEAHISGLLMAGGGDLDREDVIALLRTSNGVYFNALKIITAAQKSTKRAPGKSNPVIKTEKEDDNTDGQIQIGSEDHHPVDHPVESDDDPLVSYATRRSRKRKQRTESTSEQREAAGPKEDPAMSHAFKRSRTNDDRPPTEARYLLRGRTSKSAAAKR